MQFSCTSTGKTDLSQTPEKVILALLWLCANARDPSHHKYGLLALIKAHCEERFLVHRVQILIRRSWHSTATGVISPDVLSAGMVYVPHTPRLEEYCFR